MRTWTLVLGVLAASCSTDTFTSGDASNPSDASDASDERPGDATSGPFCATLTPAPFFCMDFDEGDPSVAFQKGAQIQVQAPQPATGATFALGADGISGSGDGIFKTSAIGSGTHDDWYAQPVTYDSVIGGMSLKFAWRLDAYKQSTNPTGSSSAEIAHLSIHDNGGTGATPLLAILFLTADNHAGMTFNGSDGSMFQQLALPPMAAWHQLELKVTLLAQSVARFDVLVDGSTIGNLQNHGTFVSPQSDFTLGSSVTGAFEASGWSIDNAIFSPLLRVAWAGQLAWPGHVEKWISSGDEDGTCVAMGDAA